MKNLEIACCNIESVVNANKGGASRIELFENLPEGGCTPSYGLIKKAKQISNIPIYVMIRPRGGGFVYSEYELDQMRWDIEMCHQLGVDGIVLGVLDANRNVHIPICQELLTLWENKPATFHRAIDQTYDIESSVRSVIDLGFERILTSGGKPTAPEGLDTILKLKSKFGHQLSIMPGSGISIDNVILFAEFSEIHATCKAMKEDSGLFGKYYISDTNLIRELGNAFRG